MRLTKTAKEAIVLAIMSDTPRTDYIGLEAELVRAAVYRSAKPEVKAMLDSAELTALMSTRYVSAHCVSDTGYRHCTIAVRGVDRFEDSMLTKAEAKRREQLVAKSTQQFEARKKLLHELEAAIASVTTSKQFAEAFPALVKYLPEEVQPIKTLPSVSGVVAALKAAGFKSETDGKGESK